MSDTDTRPDERVEEIRRLVSMTDEELFSLPADERIGMPMEIAALVPSLLAAHDEQRARAERAEAVAEAAWKYIVVDNDPQSGGGEYWDAYNALWDALAEYRHGHQRKDALTAAADVGTTHPAPESSAESPPVVGPIPPRDSR